MELNENYNKNNNTNNCENCSTHNPCESDLGTPKTLTYVDLPAIDSDDLMTPICTTDTCHEYLLIDLQKLSEIFEKLGITEEMANLKISLESEYFGHHKLSLSAYQDTERHQPQASFTSISAYDYNGESLNEIAEQLHLDLEDDDDDYDEDEYEDTDDYTDDYDDDDYDDEEDEKIDVAAIYAEGYNSGYEDGYNTGSDISWNKRHRTNNKEHSDSCCSTCTHDNHTQNVTIKNSNTSDKFDSLVNDISDSKKPFHRQHKYRR